MLKVAIPIAAATVMVATLATAPAAPQVATAQPAHAGPGSVQQFSGLTAPDRDQLYRIARDTWTFYGVDVDPDTHLPMDNLTFAGGSTAPTEYGRYTSAANIGVYLWAVVAAQELHLVSRPQARKEIAATLHEVSTLKRYRGMLYQWYSTTTGEVIRNPGDVNCSTEPTPVFDNCYFVSNVDNGWYASGLIEVRNALPELRRQVDALLDPMDFSIFYDDGPQTHCNVNPAVPGSQPTGQMYGGYYVGLPPTQGDNWTHYYHNGALYSDPRISAYIGMGREQMPGDVWWRSWRTLPPKAPFADCQVSDPDFSWQGQWPVAGLWQDYTDPQSGKVFDVWEGHYTYPGSHLRFVPTYSGGMFEALMANEVVPETSWGPRSFGLADRRTVQVQIDYATEELGYPVWGMSPSSTADDSGGYGGFGVQGLAFPYYGGGADAQHPNDGLSQSQCRVCAPEDVVTPHASFLALDVAPRQAMANIRALRTDFPGIYGVHGFFDAVDPSTGSVGHRYLVLDQSMIMAALANALDNRVMQRNFARDADSWAARTYLGMETMSLQPNVG